MRQVALSALLMSCFLLFSQETRAAETYVYTDISFDDETGRVNAYAYTQPDYASNVYYNRVGVFARIINATTGVELAYTSRENTGCCTSQVSLQIDGEADQEYEVQGGHYLFETVYRSNYYYNGYYTSGYSDYYNYGRYEGQVPGPNGVEGFTFFGPGPEIITYNNLRRLGQTKKRALVGRPHHLKVIRDDTRTSSICGTPIRDITFQVVDVNGRGTGRTTVKESFFDKQYGTPMASVYNSCRDNPISPTPCVPTDAGTNAQFVDTLSVGCPMVSGDCGTSEFLARWSWCPAGGSEVTLTTNTYDIRRNTVLVNGVAKYDPNTHLY